MRVQRGKLAWIALAIVLIVVGCGPDVAQSPPTAAPTPVPPTQTAAPTAITEALPFPVDGAFTKVGYTWEFKADGTYNTTSKYVDSDGVYTLTADQIAIQEDFVPCKDIVGTYTWTYDGEVLSFTVVDDKCRDRVGVVRGKWRTKP